MLSSLRTWPFVAFTFIILLLVGVLVTVLTFSSIGSLRSSVIGMTDARRATRDHIEALRAQIYISSVVVRDFLLEPDPERVVAHRRRLRETHESALRHLVGLQRFASAQSKKTMQSLSSEVHAYWASIEKLIADKEETRVLDRYAYVRSQVHPRRQAVIALAEELADLSAADARAGRQALTESLDEFEQYIVILRALTTLFVVVLGVFVTVRIYRLERRSAAEHKRVEAAEAELRKLSQQLVSSQEQERRSLSRELHDHVGQMMTALRFGLSDLEDNCPKPTDAFTAALRNSRTMLEQTIEAIRGLAMGLRPSMLDDLGLAAAIEWQAREFSRQFDMPVSVNVDPRLADWPEPQRTALYRITQEALTNCARHAKAKSVRIDLVRDHEAVRLKITDDGVGLATGQTNRGFGLIGMEERVREIGGMLRMRSANGHGTTVEVEVPVAGAKANA